MCFTAVNNIWDVNIRPNGKCPLTASVLSKRKYHKQNKKCVKLKLQWTGKLLSISIIISLKQIFSQFLEQLNKF